MAALPVAADVARFLGRGDDAGTVALAGEHLPLVAAFMRSYTRGRGFDNLEGAIADDLAAVVVSATARLVANPAQVAREEADGWSSIGAFNGFSLPELAVLHRYRRRTA